MSSIPFLLLNHVPSVMEKLPQLDINKTVQWSFYKGFKSVTQPLEVKSYKMGLFSNATKIYSLVRQEEKQPEIHSLSPTVAAPKSAALTIKPNNGDNRFNPAYANAS